MGQPGLIAEPQIGLLAILNLVGVGQALLFAGALLGARRADARANRLLAAQLVVIAILLVWNVLFHTRYLLRWPHLAQLHVPFEFLIGPLLFWYLRALLRQSRGFARRDALHLLPAIACAIYLMPFYLQDADAKRAYLQGAIESYPLAWRVRTALLFVLGGGYFIALSALPGLVRGASAHQADRADRVWARIWAGALAVIVLAGLARYLIDYGIGSNLVVPLLFTILVNAAVYLRLRATPATAAEPAPARKYERSTLTAERAERYLQRLLALMENERVYTAGDLTLAKLADRLAVPPHHLSQLLNERLGKSFNDFVNSYRVEDAKRRLLDPRESHFSIVAIGESAGFTSKSAFNAAFKKHTGTTPSGWRDRHRQEAEPEP